MLGVRLRGFGRVVRGMGVVAVSSVRVMRRPMVIALRVVLRGFTMMLGRIVVMVRSLLMVLRSLFGHDASPFARVGGKINFTMPCY